VPTGGTTGQLLAKNTNANYDTAWIPAPSGGGLSLPLGQALTFSPDNTYDVGAVAANRPRTVYAATSFIGPGAVPTGGASGDMLVKSSASNYALSWTAPFTQTLADARYLTPATAASTYVPLAGGSVMTGLLGPTTTNTRDLGTTALRWRKVWTVDIESTNVPTVNGVSLDTRYALAGSGLTLPLGQNLTFSPDNTYDIGAAGATRPYRAYIGGSVITPSVDTQNAGPTTNNGLVLRSNNTARWIVLSTGEFVANADNTYDIGASGAQRPRTIYVGTTLFAGVNVSTPAVESTSGLRVNGTSLSFQISGVNKWTVSSAGHLLAATDNTLDIGASGATRPRYVYAGTGVITPVVATALVQSGSALQFYASNAAKWRIHTTGDLWAETDNAFDIGAVGAVRPRNLYLAGAAQFGSAGKVFSVAGAYPTVHLQHPTSMAHVSGQTQAALVNNGFWDGGAWTRIATGEAANLTLNGNSLVFNYAASAGAAVPPAFTQVMAVDSLGNLALGGTITVPYQNGYKLSYSGNSPQWGMTSTGDNYNALYCGPAGLLLTNYANTVRLGMMDNIGNLSVNGIVKTTVNLEFAPSYAAAATARIRGDESNMVFYCNTTSGGFHFQSISPNQYMPLYASAFAPTSARRFKTDIRPLADPLGIVLDDRLHAVRYTEIGTDRATLGMVADDWLPALPEIVSLDDQGAPLAFDYDRLGAVTYEALKQYVTQTNARIAELERRLDA